MRLHHIGVIAHDLDGGLSLYRRLGFDPVSDPIVDLIQHNKLIFVKNQDSLETVELIAPLDQNSSVAHSKDGYHHLCYEVLNLEDFSLQFKTARIGKLFTGKIKALAFQGRYVSFAYLKNGTLIEFLEGEGNEVQ
jgi:catechol 2,3-dioxygenase-like lactoylglutathione lyase family enzyme